MTGKQDTLVKKKKKKKEEEKEEEKVLFDLFRFVLCFFLFSGIFYSYLLKIITIYAF